MQFNRLFYVQTMYRIIAVFAMFFTFKSYINICDPGPPQKNCHKGTFFEIEIYT